MTTYTITEVNRKVLIDMGKFAYTTCHSDFVMDEKIMPAMALLESLQPNTQEPCAWQYKKENGGVFVSDQHPPDVEIWNSIEWSKPLFTHPALQQPDEVVALQAKLSAAEARERQTRATLHKYMANQQQQQQAEPVSHETFDVSGDKTPLHEVESMIANALAAHGVKPS